MGDINKTAVHNDPNGEALFDHHTASLPHFLPPDSKESANFFDEQFVKARPQKHTTPDLEGVMVPGISPKSFVRLGAGSDPDNRRQPDRTFMIKPFFEHHDWSHSFYPLDGFSELATQAMFDAGGIGHLHHMVHGFHHGAPDGRKYPLLAIELHPEAEDMANAILPHKWDDDTLDNAAKIGIMDYLTNNQDRHGKNLMVYGDEQKQLLAVDHGRSFQYRTGNRYAPESDYQDHPFWYLGLGGSPAMRFFENKDKRGASLDDRDFPLLERQRVSRTLAWFLGHEGKMRDALEQHLAHFHDQDAASWIRQNFNERAAKLKQWEDLWATTGGDDIKLYMPSDYAQGEEENHPLSLPIRRNVLGEQFAEIPEDASEAA